MDGGVWSCDVHVIKPDAEIYRILFEKYGLVPEECLFIDDHGENIAIGKKFGMKGIVFRDHDQLTADLEKALTKDATHDRITVLCYGDSNTYGYDPRSFFGSQYPAQHRWVDLLAKKLDYEVINAGENGREIPRWEGERMCFDLMLANQKPIDLLTIMLGSNDLLQGNSVDAVIKRMESFLEHIDLEPSKILLIGPPTMQLGEWVPVQTLIDASVALNHEYKALSERLGVHFVNAGEWNIPLTFDGVHFTEEGHKAFAESLATYLHKGE
jgi:lysophospholipase L1-like esterase